MAQLKKQPTNRPTRKVRNGIIALPIATVALALLELIGVPVDAVLLDPEGDSVITLRQILNAVIPLAVAYFTKERVGE